MENDPVSANLLASDGKGNVLEIPGYEILGRTGNDLEQLSDEVLIQLPEGSELFELPGRRPVALDCENGEVKEVAEFDGNELFAVSAFPPPAHTITHTAAFARGEGAPVLPLFAYSPVGWRDGGFVTGALRTDEDRRQDPALFDREQIETKARGFLQKYRGNRLVEHITGTCALEYGCPAAMNYVLGRWEMPVPTSRECNAGCVGCISRQPDGTFSSTQERIGFTPTAGEIIEAAVDHIDIADNPIVSFGQGCEGEPLLAAGVIAEAIKGIRERTGRGTLNLNTNASLPDRVEELFHAGLTSMRVSINSARPEFYHRYYRPRGFGFDDVLESMRRAKESGGFLSLNYLVFPGFTDSPSEISSMSGIISTFAIDMIQWRNLNIDPDLYLDLVGPVEEKGIGIDRMIETFRGEFPGLLHGYFNPFLSTTG